MPRLHVSKEYTSNKHKKERQRQPATSRKYKNGGKVVLVTGGGKKITD